MSKDGALPLRLCTLVTSDHGEEMKPFVRCPRRGKTIDAHTCAGCTHMRSIEWDPTIGGDIRCSVDPPAVRTDARADIAETLARVLIHEVVAPITIAMTPDLPLTRARALFAEHPATRYFPVQDQERNLRGMITASSVLNAPADATTVADLVTPMRALPEDTPLSYAIALMALENVTEVAVVTNEGIVIGVCETLGPLRWLIKHLGYHAAHA